MNVLQLSILRQTGCAGGCKFCGLSVDSTVDRGAPTTQADFRAAFAQARAANARVELVFASVGADQREVLSLLAAMAGVIAENRDVELAVNPGICTVPGFYTALAAHGVSRYRNNLETSRRLFRELVPARPLAQGPKLESLALARAAGLRVDTGWLCGLGEDDADVEDMLELLAESTPDSITLNYFDPRESAVAFAHTEPSGATGRVRLRALRRRFPGVEITLGGAYELWLGAGARGLAEADGVYVGRFLDHGLRDGRSPAAEGAGAVGSAGVVESTGVVQIGRPGAAGLGRG